MDTHGNKTTIDLLNGAQLVLHQHNQSIVLTTNDKISFVTRTTEENLVDDVCISKISIVISRVETKDDKHPREIAQESSALDQHIPTKDKNVPQTTLLKEALHLEVDKSIKKTKSMPGPDSLRTFIHAQEEYPGWTQIHPYKLTSAGEHILLNKPELISDFLKPDDVKLPIDESEIVRYLKANRRKLELEALEEENAYDSIESMKAKLSVTQSDTVSVTSTLTQNDSMLLTLLKNGLGAKSSVTSKKITIGNRNFFIIPDNDPLESEKDLRSRTGTKQRCLLICARQSAKSMNPIDFYENKKKFELNISRRMLTPKKGEKPDERTQIEMEAILSHIHNILT